jgi:hypothetical protein
MDINTLDAAQTGGSLLVNYMGTSYVGDNLRWNGEPTDPTRDSPYMDRRLIGGVVGMGLSVFSKEGSLLQSVGRAFGDGLLNSFVTTETLRGKLLRPGGGGAPPPQRNAAPKPQPEPEAVKGDLSGFWR